jgi:hypothetical protein
MALPDWIRRFDLICYGNSPAEPLRESRAKCRLTCEVAMSEQSTNPVEPPGRSYRNADVEAVEVSQRSTPDAVALSNQQADVAARRQALLAAVERVAGP